MREGRRKSKPREGRNQAGKRERSNRGKARIRQKERKSKQREVEHKPINNINKTNVDELNNSDRQHAKNKTKTKVPCEADSKRKPM